MQGGFLKMKRGHQAHRDVGVGVDFVQKCYLFLFELLKFNFQASY